MVRGPNGGYQGNFGEYSASDFMNGIGSTDDETAIEDAIMYMFSMCGNAGQETLIGDHVEDFEMWALPALEEEGAFGTFADMMSRINYDDPQKFRATEQIWEGGYDMMVGQSTYHDHYDEQGEGEGDNVAGPLGLGD